MAEIVCAITDRELDLATLMSHLNQDSYGAVIWFVGNVRNLNEGREVSAVTYEGVVPLGEKTLGEICQECQNQWGSDLGLLVAHRIGCLKVGETSVVIGVASPHRNAAYEASRYIIEQIKRRLPIWKREHYVSGEDTWLRGMPLGGTHELKI